jgi:ribosomal protein L5
VTIQTALRRDGSAAVGVQESTCSAFLEKLRKNKKRCRDFRGLSWESKGVLCEQK